MGTCDDANPGNDFPAVSVNAGATTTADLPMAAVKVTVTNAYNAPVAGALVTAAHVATAGEVACPSTGTPSYTLTATDVLGEVRASLPWGTWRFTSTTPGASEVQVVLEPPITAEVGVGVTVP